MISEHKLANEFTSFWREIAPMGDVYWRSQNLVVERFAIPYRSSDTRANRAIISELAFEIFCETVGIKSTPTRTDLEALGKVAIVTVLKYLSRFPDMPQIKASDIDSSSHAEAVALAERLLSFFKHYDRSAISAIRPKFSGCGIVASCEGDLLTGDTLYEIKAGDRNFRITDLRQLIIYCALARAEGTPYLKHMSLINPRTGVYWHKSLELVARSISGKSSAEMLDDVIEYISAPISSL